MADPKSATPVYDEICALVARFEKEDMPYHLRAHRMADRAYSLAHQLDLLHTERLASPAEREGVAYWVIEKGENPAFYWKITHREKGQTKYYRGCWVGDVQLATMFSHKENAEEEMQFMLNNSDERELRVCGHINVASPAPSPADGLAEFEEWWEQQDKGAFKKSLEELGVVHSWCKAAWLASSRQAPRGEDEEQKDVRAAWLEIERNLGKQRPGGYISYLDMAKAIVADSTPKRSGK